MFKSFCLQHTSLTQESSSKMGVLMNFPGHLIMANERDSLALEDPQKGILRVESYDAERLRFFIHDEHENTMNEWARYHDRRELGVGPTLFGNIAEARTWVAQRAPAKIVDGAWLSHIHKITTPFALRGVTKDAWQILSEELGDGDVTRNHDLVYNQLLKEIGCPLQDPQSHDFIKSSNLKAMDDQRSWKGAVAQLLISLFPNEFLPEILGFNMHYELISLEALMAARELKELGVNPSYFLLHICIDNADSGHTGMALLNVIDYLEFIKATKSPSVLEEHWRRVQAGYTLSQTLAVSPCDGNGFSESGIQASRCVSQIVPTDSLSRQTIEIFKSKSTVSPKYHCQSKVKIGNRTLAEWLDSSLWKHEDEQKHIEAFGGACPELSWGGRMFGAFTNEELDALIAWIDLLGPENSTWLYYRFTFRVAVASRDVVGGLQDPACHHPTLAARNADETINGAFMEELPNCRLDAECPAGKLPLNPPSKSQLPDIVALWFAHIGLLENMINVPARTATSLYSSILLALRAQAGFAIEAHIPAGMAEISRQPGYSLVDIGLELISSGQWIRDANPSCLKDVFILARKQGQSAESIELSDNMLRWANRPDEKFGLLVGLALAFLGLKEAVARSHELLSEEIQAALKVIVEREEKSLFSCMQEIENTDDGCYKDIEKGYCLGRSALEKLLGKTAGDTNTLGMCAA
ncbi:uncharacterized protein N7498_004126 [Penicillium cinerascens]|uniref:Iron-containing redox enzyme family protein n=1 Tax=Penicillium cinerascens TaxID=70096 RepID=A0A9W9T8J1_9EURO|nr:uncharacterized protein N7498_004126 [Penicillium cinerascens]KAJ5212480.1 hypothetical protein N7498_004126 [Penicillium cinerascens]